jgi:menaquinone-9 beta-reductase
MGAPKHITIIGGGLAGLTLGIALRQREVPVTIREAGQYPRHRVCGEFISGNGPAVLGRLGLLEPLESAGAFHARTVMFLCGRNRSPVRQLDAPAICLSRHTMDAVLADTFQKRGGELRVNARCTSEGGEGTVIASGRRASASENRARWFGVKAHATESDGLKLDADLEMHISSGGYVGVNRINDGEVNVCGLLRARPGGGQPASKSDWLRGEAGSFLRSRLDGVEFGPGTFCSVGGLSLRPQRAARRTECCIGDAVTMTPPVTGNGMSMAFEAAELALEPLTRYSQGNPSWADTQRRIALACDAAFTRRLAWARMLQWLMISPVSRGPLGAALLRSQWLWAIMFSKTR